MQRVLLVARPKLQPSFFLGCGESLGVTKQSTQDSLAYCGSCAQSLPNLFETHNPDGQVANSLGHFFLDILWHQFLGSHLACSFLHTPRDCGSTGILRSTLLARPPSWSLPSMYVVGTKLGPEIDWLILDCRFIQILIFCASGVSLPIDPPLMRKSCRFINIIPLQRGSSVIMVIRA